MPLLKFLKDEGVDLGKVDLQPVHLNNQKKHPDPLVFVGDGPGRYQFYEVGLDFHLEEVGSEFGAEVSAKLLVVNAQVSLLDIIDHLERIGLRQVFFLAVEQDALRLYVDRHGCLDNRTCSQTFVLWVPVYATALRLPRGDYSWIRNEVHSNSTMDSV